MIVYKQKKLHFVTNTGEGTGSPETTVRGRRGKGDLHTAGPDLGCCLARLSFGNETPQKMKNKSPLGLFLIILIK